MYIAISRIQNSHVRRAPFTPIGGFITNSIALMVGVAVLLSAASLASAEDSWVGKTVIPKRHGLKFASLDNSTGKASAGGRVDKYTYAVEAEKAGLIKISRDGEAGWVARADVVRVEDAVVFFSQVLQATPTDDDAIARRAAAYFGQNDPFHAIQDIDEAIRKGSADPMRWALRARIRLESRHFDRAIEDSNQAVMLDAKLAEAYLLRGKARSYLNDIDKGLDDFNRAIRLNPKGPEAWASRGNTWVVKTDYAKALSDYDEAIRLGPNQALSYYARGLAHFDLRHFDKAIEDLNRAIKLNPKDCRFFHGLGLVYGEKRDYGKALASFDRAIDLCPEYALARFGKGLVYSHKDDFDNAIKNFDDAIRLDPSLADAFLNRGLAWSQKKEFKKALEDFNESTHLKPDNAKAILNRGLAWWRLKNYRRALQDFDLAIQKSEDCAPALNLKARLLATCPAPELRDGAAAVRLGKTACELSEHKYGWHLDTLAAAYAEICDFEQAIKVQLESLMDEEFKRACASKVAERLKLYKAKKPYREE